MIEIHPVLNMADRALSRDENGKYVLDEQGAILLEAMILEHAEDTELPHVLWALFDLVARLESELDSAEAAFGLMIVLGKVQPALRHLAPDVEKLIQRQADETMLKARKKDVEKLSGPPPAGAVSVRSLNIPPLTPARPKAAKPRAKSPRR